VYICVWQLIICLFFLQGNVINYLKVTLYLQLAMKCRNFTSNCIAVGSFSFILHSLPIPQFQSDYVPMLSNAILTVFLQYRARESLTCQLV